MPYGQFRFFNVGQGMFYVGKIIPDGFDASSFSFVYDCGVSGTSVFLNNAIHNSKQLIGRQSLDALFVSHFDIDHVSGIPKLLEILDMDENEHRIKTVILPYFPLEIMQLIRLQVLHEVSLIEKTENVDQLYRLLFNPYAYFLERKDIDRLIVVSPLDMASRDKNIISDEWDNDGENKLDIKFIHKDMKAEKELLKLAEEDIDSWNHNDNKKTSLDLKERLVVLNGEAAGTFSNMWRWKVLVPPIPKEIINAFKNKIYNARILNKDGILEWDTFQKCCKQKDKNNQVRKKLLDAYNDIVNELRKSSSVGADKTINMTSLVMAHEPVCKCTLNESQKTWVCGREPSTILFGDTDLGNPVIYENIIKGMCQELQKAAVLTIPHHGSSRNWNRDILSVPRRNSIWIATSGTDEQQPRLHHPDGSVVYDIWEASKSFFSTCHPDFEWNNEKKSVDVLIFRDRTGGSSHWGCNVKTEQRERVLSSQCRCWQCCDADC